MDTLEVSFAASRPGLDLEGAAELASTFWGKSGVIRELPSERDQNFLLDERAPRTAPPEDGDAGEDGNGRFVLKISNAAEAPELLALEREVLEHLAAAETGYAFPRTVLTLEGEPLAETGVATDAGQHLVRLLTWVPGEPFGRVWPHSPPLLGRLGRFLGTLDRALDGFSHPAARRSLVWDLRGATELIDCHLDAIAAARRVLIERTVARTAQLIDPRAEAFRVGVIHNDANDANLIVHAPRAGRPDELAEPGERDGFHPRVAGVIDFGDMVESWIAAELAVGCAYAMLDRSDPLAAAAAITRGFHEVFPLTEAEADCLYELIRLRLCLSVTIAAVRQPQEPDNEYLSVNEASAWELLERLDATSPDLARYILRDACGYAPCPNGERLRSWLRSRAGELAPLVSGDLERRVVLDLSLESPVGAEIDVGVETSAQMEAWTRHLFRRMEDAEAEVGIGRYREVRSWYAGEAFLTPGAERDEWRSIHIGVDLFQPPGSPVFAPLDGVVHSFADNAERLDYGPTIVLEHEVSAGSDRLRFWTLFGHLSADSLDGLEIGQAVGRGEEVGRIGDRPGNGDWPPHLHFQLLADTLGEQGTFAGVAAPSLVDVWCSISPDPNLVLGFPEGIRGDREGTGHPGKDWIRSAREARLGPSLSLSYRNPLHIVRGYRQQLYDAEGQPYLDAVNNVPHVGHSHPRVVRAAVEQMAVLNTNTRYLHERIVRLADRLAATMPDPLGVCFFVCSGSEANELALRLARVHTGGTDVVVIDGAYHGNSSSLVEISPYKFDGPGGQGAPDWVEVVPMPDPYRGLYRSGAAPEGDGGSAEPAEIGRRYADHVREAVDAIAGRDRKLAAFFAESLLGCGGQIVPAEGYLRQAFEYVREAGGVCVADEVQIGFGRVGSHFWAFETQYVVPDIVTLGKPMGNGHPVAAVVTTPEIAASFDTGMEYFNTFGGNPVSCAIAEAVLDVVEEERLQENALRVGRRLLAGLRNLMERHPRIGDVRGLGLYLGIELVLDREIREPAPDHAAWAVERMRERGILLSTDGPDHNVIKIKPPLCFSEADADRLVETLDSVLAEDAFRS